MNVRLAAWTAPRPVPARIATTQKWSLVTTKNAAMVTSAHCTRLTPTTKRGPRASVGRAHAAEESGVGWRAWGGKVAKAGLEKTAKRAAAATKQPPYAWAAANGYAAANATSEPA